MHKRKARKEHIFIEFMMFFHKNDSKKKLKKQQSNLPQDFKAVCIICRTLDQCSLTCDEANTRKKRRIC